MRKVHEREHTVHHIFVRPQDVLFCIGIRAHEPIHFFEDGWVRFLSLRYFFDVRVKVLDDLSVQNGVNFINLDFIFK